MRTIQEKNSSYNMMLRIWCDLCTFKRVVCICISFESKLDTEYTLCSVCHMICPHFGHETKVVDREMEKNSSHVDVRLLGGVAGVGEPPPKMDNLWYGLPPKPLLIR